MISVDQPVRSQIEVVLNTAALTLVLIKRGFQRLYKHEQKSQSSAEELQFEKFRLFVFNISIQSAFKITQYSKNFSHHLNNRVQN